MNRKIGPVGDDSVTRPAFDRSGLAHLIVVYMGWSATYVAIRIAVDEGFPPFSLVAVRLLVAGALLVIWAACSGERLKPSRGDLIPVIVSGLLLWVGGNSLVTWAEQRADAGYAALLVGSTPVWAALLEAVVDRKLPSILLSGSLLFGFAGVGLLSLPVLGSTRVDLLTMGALLLSPFSWAAGSVLVARRSTAMGPIASSAFQHVVGGVVLAGAAIMVREPTPTPTIQAWASLVYLIVFASVITFTSYLRALQRLPLRITMTYSFVNPIGAVVLAWLLLGERLTGGELVGALLIICGVVGVFHTRSSPRPVTPPS